MQTVTMCAAVQYGVNSGSLGHRMGRAPPPPQKTISRHAWVVLSITGLGVSPHNIT